MKKRWFRAVYKRKWFRIPYALPFLSWLSFKWLNRWYFKISFKLWEHPSNYHWHWGIPDHKCNLEPNERCFYCGCYNLKGNDERYN